jgi:putative nucleotidyltransferase with HDIG domain
MVDGAFLAISSAMSRALLLVAGGAAAALYLRARREREVTERLAAATFESLLNAIDANDPQTGAHARRVAAYAGILARAAGLDARAVHDVERVALFHDIGKIHAALFDIVHDTDSLTDAERAKIATHPERGAEVLRPLAGFYPTLPDGVLSHHERWDGKGYPRRLRGDRIPLSARIVAIADTFDAITERRRYRAPRSPSEAHTTLARGRGAHFDPKLVDLFLSPDVMRRVERARRAAGSPRVVHPERRRRGPEDEAPDVTFRWRRGFDVLPALDPVRPAARE